MHNAIYISQTDLLQLAEVLRQSRRLWGGLDALEAKLKEACILPEEELSDDIARMGSTVTFRDMLTGVIEQYRLVYPEQADLDRNRLSIFAPIGTALLGEKEGSTVWWDVPSGKRGVRILSVWTEREPCIRELAAS